MSSGKKKYPSDVEKQKLKQEVLKGASKMLKLTAYFGPLTMSSLKKRKFQKVHCYVSYQYWMVSVNKCHYTRCGY
jgi:hypothetical protein